MPDHDPNVFNREATPEDLDRAKENFWAKMKQFAGKVPFAVDAVALYYFITDPAVKLTIKATGILALLYFISPVDIVPDAIPLAGLLDDAGIIGGVVAFLGSQLKPYKDRAQLWLSDGQKIEDAPRG